MVSISSKNMVHKTYSVFPNGAPYAYLYYFVASSQKCKIGYKIKSSLYSRDYAEACNEWRGLIPRLNAWATQLRKNVASGQDVDDTVSDLTDPAFESHASSTDNNVLTTQLINLPVRSVSIVFFVTTRVT